MILDMPSNANNQGKTYAFFFHGEETTFVVFFLDRRPTLEIHGNTGEDQTLVPL